MNRFEELIKSVSAMPSIIVHLGAGACKEHEYYRTICSGLIIYVEADQTLADSAAITFNNTADVKVIPLAVAAENGRQTLNITNNRRFSSLLLPDKLLGFYPNIEVQDTAEVEAITVTRLCQNEAVNKDTDNLLIAELQGLEKAVFASTEIGTLQRFKWIIIRSGETNLYTSVSDDAQRSLSETMQDAGYMVLDFAEEAPPFINILCVRNDPAIENSKFRALKSNLLDTIRVLEHNLSKNTADLEVLKTNTAAEKANLQRILTSRSVELEVLKTNTDAEKADLQRILTSRSVELEVLKTNTDAKKANLQRILTSRSVELEKIQALIQSASDAKESQQLQVTALTQSLKEREKEISVMQQTLRINNKLILKSDTDLRELQVQYRTALQHQEHQHTLLSELKDKLRQASEFYQKLNLQSPVIDSDMLEQDDPDSNDDGHEQ